MWANDYPHHEGSWPHSAASIERQMSGLTDESRAKILGRQRSPRLLAVVHGAAVVVGVGESPYYKRGGATESEFQLACIAIRNAVADAGLTMRDVDGFVVVHGTQRAGATERRARHRATSRFTAQTFGGGGNGAGAAVTLADAAISAGYARMRRRVPRRSPRASSPATGRPGERGARAELARSRCPTGCSDARADLRDADAAVHARPRRHAGQPRRGRARLLRARAAQPTSDPLRHPADA